MASNKLHRTNHTTELKIKINNSLDSLVASGGGNAPPKISLTTIGMTLTFLPDVGSYKEEQNKKN